MKKLFRRHKHTAECEEKGCSEKVCGEMYISISILIAALLISGSILFTDKNGSEAVYPSDAQGNNNQQVQQPSQDIEAIKNARPISKDDHIRGSLNAPITIVEYSDLECPFCKRFHDTMKQVVDVYGNDVAWVYRHAPLDQLHSKARKEAEASECAAELGGNNAFWAYVDRVNEVTPGNNGLDSTELPKIAEYVGLNVSKFNACLDSGKYADKVQADLDNVLQSGFRGTPYSIIFVKGVPKDIIPGALPFSLKDDPSGQKGVKEILDDIMKDL